MRKLLCKVIGHRWKLTYSTGSMNSGWKRLAYCRTCKGYTVFVGTLHWWGVEEPGLADDMRNSARLAVRSMDWLLGTGEFADDPESSA